MIATDREDKEIDEVRERWLGVLCGLRAVSGDTIQYVLRCSGQHPERWAAGTQEKGFSLPPTGCSGIFLFWTHLTDWSCAMSPPVTGLGRETKESC